MSNAKSMPQCQMTNDSSPDKIRTQNAEKRVAGPDEIRTQRSEKRSQKYPGVLPSVFSSLPSAFVRSRHEVSHG